MVRVTAEEREADILQGNFLAVMNTTQGKEVLWVILELCGIYDDKFSGTPLTDMLLGKTAVGLDILQILSDIDPTFYPKLLLTKAEAQNG